MSAMFDDYEELMRVLSKAPPLDEERAQMMAEELVSGLRGEEREAMLGVLVELVYKLVPEPSQGAAQEELDRWKRHLGIVDAIARLAESGEGFEQRAKIDLQKRRRERAAAFRRANDPLPSPAWKEEDDEPTLAEISAMRYGQGDYERWLAPIIYSLATPEPEVEVSRADEVMKLLWVLESGNRAEREMAYGVAMSHAYSFTESGRQQQVSYLARIVSRCGADEQGRQGVDEKQETVRQDNQGEEYNRLKSQEQIMAKLMMDTTPDSVIQATLEGLVSQLEGHTQPGQAASR